MLENLVKHEMTEVKTGLVRNNGPTAQISLYIDPLITNYPMRYKTDITSV